MDTNNLSRTNVLKVLQLRYGRVIIVVRLKDDG